LGIGQGQQLQEYFRVATRLILYEQYVTGRWIHYAQELDVQDWSPYVTHLLDDCLRISSEAEGRRWAVAIEVIAALYHPDARRRFGIVYQGDPVIDHETGEVVADVTEGFPATAEEAVRDSFNRFSREAGVRLRNLFREADRYFACSWDTLQLCPTRTNEEEELINIVTEIRRILNLATSAKDDKQVNREAVGGKSMMPAWVLPEDTPPAWASYLANQFPDAVSNTSSLSFGKRYVQVRCIVWPKCKDCGEPMVIAPEYPLCIMCGDSDDRVDKRYHFSTWETRIADENGKYPEGWTTRDKPTEWVNRSVPEVMDIHGLKVSVWEIAVDLEELDG